MDLNGWRNLGVGDQAVSRRTQYCCAECGIETCEIAADGVQNKKPVACYCLALYTTSLYFLWWTLICAQVIKQNIYIFLNIIAEISLSWIKLKLSNTAIN